MKPKVFEIYKDGELLEAKAADRDNQRYLEQSILKMNMKTFIQVVILGSGNFVPFMQLPAAARRDCVEDFLDIKVFTAMSMLAKERLRGLKDEHNAVKGDVSNVEYKIDLQKDRIKEIEERSESDIEELQKEIAEAKHNLSSHQTSVESLQEDNASVLSEIEKLMEGSPKETHSKLNKKVISYDSKLEELRTHYRFFQKNDQCPTCTQEITTALKDEIKEKIVDKSKDFISSRDTINVQLSEVQKVVDLILEKEKKSTDIQQTIYKHQTSINHFQQSITTKESKITAIASSKSGVMKEKGKLEALQEQLTDLSKKRDALVMQIHNYGAVVSLLKDSGIKTQIVRKYLPVMNNLIRKYLSDLDLPLMFTLDEEFKEQVSSPMYQDFSYESFSEGQKSRIDLALMFTWREIGKLKNSVSTNLLILDEVFSSSLDDVGKESLLALLRYGLSDSHRILVVDHTLNAAFKEKFAHNIEVSKVKGFSKYVSSSVDVG